MTLKNEEIKLYNDKFNLVKVFQFWKIIEFIDFKEKGMILGFSTGFKLYISYDKSQNKIELSKLFAELNTHKKKFFDTMPLIIEHRGSDIVEKYEKLYYEYFIPIPKPMLWKNSNPDFFNELYILRFEKPKLDKSEKKITKISRRKSIDFFRMIDLDSHLEKLTGIVTQEVNLEKSRLVQFDNNAEQSITEKRNLEQSDLSMDFDEDEIPFEENNKNTEFVLAINGNIVNPSHKVVSTNKMAVNINGLKVYQEPTKNLRKANSAQPDKKPLTSEKNIPDTKKIKSSIKLNTKEASKKSTHIISIPNIDQKSKKSMNYLTVNNNESKVASNTSISEKKVIGSEKKTGKLSKTTTIELGLKGKSGIRDKEKDTQKANELKKGSTNDVGLLKSKIVKNS